MRGICFTLTCLTILLTSCDEKKPHILKIAAASSLQMPLDSLISTFQEFNETDIKVNYASSGLLAMQIRTGAPYEYFISANKEYAKALLDEGFVEKSTFLCRSKVKCFYPHKYGSMGLEEIILNNEVKRIGIADPELAPYGSVAMGYLKSIESFELIEEKIKIAENASQVNQWLQTKSVDVAFSTMTYQKQFAKNWNSTTVESKIEIIYEGSEVLGSKAKKNEMKTFINFLSSPKAASIFLFFGLKQ